MNVFKNNYLRLIALFTIFSVSFSACSEDDDSIIEDDPIEENLPDISGYPIVGTNQSTAYNNSTVISLPSSGDDFHGQNANYVGNTISYVNNGDGTVTDMVTGLMWSQTADLNGDGTININDKLSLSDALSSANTFNKGGYDDWRLPTIKELYSLIIFSGEDPSGYEGTSTEHLVPFINTDYFGFGYGDTDAGERIIDAQYATSTEYVDYTMMGDATVFGVNFADGRIKGYPLTMRGIDKKFNIAYVRGNTSYGVNSFTNNGDETITDDATDLMWMQNDNGADGLNWEEALTYAENFEFAGYSDWRLPNVKELQSILDYTRSPETSNSAAIDALFSCTEISNENGVADYSCYWSSTTHASMSTSAKPGASGAYVSFGRAMGYMNGQWLDVHGAGAQRSDPKMGDPNDYPEGFGPQGDARRIYNAVRLVRSIN